MCREPRATIRSVLTHCRLEATDSWIDERAAGIRFPSYYRADFAPGELEVIARHTAQTAARFGYSGADASHGRSSPP
jgi:hypothetical protein